MSTCTIRIARMYWNDWRYRKKKSQKFSENRKRKTPAASCRRLSIGRSSRLVSAEVHDDELRTSPRRYFVDCLDKAEIFFEVASEQFSQAFTVLVDQFCAGVCLSRVFIHHSRRPSS